eukprot:CAMPEP_0195065154 /NCGR_PEP_ID=MMETSP0448-20130528/10896_1 /TAXON_ID=66468 /ORGANISM="Heterocapsa triquestra, Strain CCMP 448" /LENGTH=85 /DNA_ID=CAMNT_0040096225 /DNA_START=22 /DNA_END=279 /DNA_ORIENTATION=+
MNPPLQVFTVFVSIFTGLGRRPLDDLSSLGSEELWRAQGQKKWRECWGAHNGALLSASNEDPYWCVQPRSACEARVHADAPLGSA